MAAKKLPTVGLSFINIDSAAIVAIANLLAIMIQTTPAGQHARNHARAERILTYIEENIFKLPPLDVK